MTNFPDLNRLRLDATDPVRTRQGTTRRRKRVDGLFLKGPIPWAWLGAAVRLPGRALHVALWIRLSRPK